MKRNRPLYLCYSQAAWRIKLLGCFFRRWQENWSFSKRKSTFSKVNQENFYTISEYFFSRVTFFLSCSPTFPNGISEYTRNVPRQSTDCRNYQSFQVRHLIYQQQTMNFSELCSYITPYTGRRFISHTIVYFTRSLSPHNQLILLLLYSSITPQAKLCWWVLQGVVSPNMWDMMYYIANIWWFG